MYMTRESKRQYARPEQEEVTREQEQNEWIKKLGEKRIEREKKEQLEKEIEEKRLEEEKLKKQQEQQKIAEEKKKQEQLRLEQEKLKEEQLEKQKQKEAEEKQKEQEKIQQEELEKAREKAQLELKMKLESESKRLEESEKDKKTLEEQENTRKLLEMDSTIENQEKVEVEEQIDSKNLTCTEKADQIIHEAKNITGMEMKKEETIENNEPSESESKRVEALLTDAEHLLSGLNFDSKNVKSSTDKDNGQEKPSSKNENSTQMETETDVFFDAVSIQLPSIFDQQEEVRKITAADEVEAFSSAASENLERAEPKSIQEISIKTPEKKETQKINYAPKRKVEKSEPREKMKLEEFSRSPSFRLKEGAFPAPVTSHNQPKLQIRIPVQILENSSKKVEPAQNIQLAQFETENVVKFDPENLRWGENADFEYDTESERERDECCPLLAFILPCLFAPLK